MVCALIGVGVKTAVGDIYYRNTGIGCDYRVSRPEDYRWSSLGISRPLDLNPKDVGLWSNTQ